MAAVIKRIARNQPIGEMAAGTQKGTCAKVPVALNFMVAPVPTYPGPRFYGGSSPNVPRLKNPTPDGPGPEFYGGTGPNIPRF